MIQINIDEKLADETQKLSPPGRSLEEIAEKAFRSYLAQLRLQELWGKFEPDDFWEEPEDNE